MRESIELGSLGQGGRRAGQGGGEELSEKVFIDLLTSALTQGNSVRVCQVDKLREGILGKRNSQEV